MKVCQRCGSKLTVKNEERVHYLESGLDNIYLDGIIQYECLECSKNHAEIPAVKDLNFLIVINLVFKKGELTWEEIKFLERMIHEECWNIINGPFDDNYTSGPMVFHWNGKSWSYAQD